MWVGKIVHRLVHAWIRCFGHKGQGGGLEGAQHPLQLIMCERADVAARRELTIDNFTIYIFVGKDGGVIGWDICLFDLWHSHVETLCEALNQMRVSPIQIQPRELLRPRLLVVGGEGVTPSVLEGILEPHDQIFHIQSTCVNLGG